MKQIRRIVWIVIAVVVLALAVATGFGYAYKDKVIPILTEELNKHLLTDVQVDAIDFSVIDRFPYASIRFDGITAKGTHVVEGENDTLFRAAHLYLSFNILDVIEGRYHVRSIELEKGELNLHRNSEGQFNYEIWKSDTTAPDALVTFNVEEMVLRDIDLLYIDQSNKHLWRAHTDKLTAKGAYDPNEMSLAAYGSINNKQLTLHDVEYLDVAKVNIDLGIEISPQAGRFQFSRGGLALKGSKLDVKGTIDGERVSLNIRGEDIQLKEVVKRLPSEQRTTFEAYAIEGRGNVNLSIDVAEQTLIDAHFSLSNSSFTLPEQQIEVSKIDAQGQYTLKNNRDELRLDTFNLTVFNDIISGNGVIQDLGKPQWNIWMYGSLDLSEIREIAEEPQLSGKVRYSGTTKGKFYGDTFDIHDVVAASNQFNLELLDVSNGGDWTISSKRVEWKGHALSTEEALIRIDEQVLSFGGFVNHIFYSLNEEETLHIQGDLFTESYTWKDSEQGNTISWPNRIKGSIKLKVPHVVVGPFDGKNLVAECRISPYSLKLSPFSIDNSEGTLKGAAELRPLENKGFSSQGHVEVVGCNIPRLMDSFDQFGQENIVSSNLEGRVNASVDYNLRLDSNLQMIKPLLSATAQVQITNGVLIDYAPLTSLVPEMKKENILARLVNLDDFEQRLERIEFGELNQEILVRNQRVILPLSDIKSTALDLEVSGSTTFDFEIDFNLKFNLKAVLTRPEVKHTDYGYIADDGTGNKMVFLRVTGTVDQPIIDFNRREGKKHRQDQIEAEVKTTKSILNEEFGLFKNDSTLQKIDEKVEEIEFELELEGWSEDEKKSTSNNQDSTKKDSAKSPSEQEKKDEKGWRKLWNEISEEEESQSSSFEFD